MYLGCSVVDAGCVIMQVMRVLGGRRFVFVGLPPIGCLPIARTLLGRAPDGCDSDLNQLAASFNSRLIQLSNFVNYQPRLRSAYIDTYTIIRAATDNPQNYGNAFHISPKNIGMHDCKVLKHG